MTIALEIFQEFDNFPQLYFIRIEVNLKFLSEQPYQNTIINWPNFFEDHFSVIVENIIKIVSFLHDEEIL